MNTEARKLTDLEYALLPMAPTATLTLVAETVQDNRLTLELFHRLMVLAIWVKPRAPDRMGDALDELADLAKSKTQDLDSIVRKRSEGRVQQ
jgi:hypothetical protein